MVVGERTLIWFGVSVMKIADLERQSCSSLMEGNLRGIAGTHLTASTLQCREEFRMEKCRLGRGAFHAMGVFPD